MDDRIIYNPIGKDKSFEEQAKQLSSYDRVFDYRVTLGNELDGVRLMEPDTVKKFKAKYPDGKTINVQNKQGKNFISLFLYFKILNETFFKDSKQPVQPVLNTPANTNNTTPQASSASQ